MMFGRDLKAALFACTRSSLPNSAEITNYALHFLVARSVFDISTTVVTNASSNDLAAQIATLQQAVEDFCGIQ